MRKLLITIGVTGLLALSTVVPVFAANGQNPAGRDVPACSNNGSTQGQAGTHNPNCLPPEED